MFTGIIQGKGRVIKEDRKSDFLHFVAEFPNELVQDLKLGASVAVNGVCLTVVSIEGNTVSFDVMNETLERTSFADFMLDEEINIERSLKMGDEMGGHLLSGHVHGVGEIKHIDEQQTFTISTTAEIIRYVFTKGFIALNGVSLTVVDVNQVKGIFTVCLIPETLRRTTLGEAITGDLVNIEVDQGTKTAVDTLERLQT
jgi:riboflavin synthase